MNIGSAGRNRSLQNRCHYFYNRRLAGFFHSGFKRNTAGVVFPGADLAYRGVNFASEGRVPPERRPKIGEEDEINAKSKPFLAGNKFKSFLSFNIIRTKHPHREGISASLYRNKLVMLG